MLFGEKKKALLGGLGAEKKGKALIYSRRDRDVRSIRKALDRGNGRCCL